MKKNLFYSILIMLFLVGCNGENGKDGVVSVQQSVGSDTIAGPSTTEIAAAADIGSEEITAPVATDRVVGGSDTIDSPEQ